MTEKLRSLCRVVAKAAVKGAQILARLPGWFADQIRCWAELNRIQRVLLCFSLTVMAVGVIGLAGYGVSLLSSARTKQELREVYEETADIAAVSGFVDVMKTVHSVEMAPGTLPSARENWLQYLDSNLQRGYISSIQHDRIKQLLNDLPDSCRIVHGDFHMKNVMVVEGEPLLIDMDTLTQGSPIFDLQGIYMAYEEFLEDEPGNAMAFMGISDELSKRVWNETIDCYFDTKNAEKLTVLKNKIRLVAAVRFLQIIGMTDLKSDKLAATRIRHTQAVIDDLLEKVDSLALE